MLVELSVVEQRYHAVMEVISGLPHAGCVVTIELGDTTLRVIDPSGELLTTVPRNGNGEISRFKAYGSRRSR